PWRGCHAGDRVRRPRRRDPSCRLPGTIEMRAVERALAIGIVTLWCGGCLVGPDYKKPAVDAPPEHRGLSPEERARAEAASFGDEKWWAAFQDEVLRDLIRRAVEQNSDVRIAAVRILEARARLGITTADQFPSVEANASATRLQSPDSGIVPGGRSSALRVGL